MIRAAVDDDMTPAQAHVLEMLRAQQDVMRAHEAGTRRGRDPEELHGMRTAVRRLRAVLRAVSPVFARSPAPLRRELRWLGARLGAVRDLDVLIGHVSADVSQLEPAQARVARRLLHRLAAERRRARRTLLVVLKSERYRRLLAVLDTTLRYPRLADDVSLRAVARRAFKRLRRAVRALPDTPSDTELHAVRIKLKRARYAAEIARQRVGRRATRFVHKAERLQDILGEHQDAAVLEARLRTLGAAAEPLASRQRRRRRDAWRRFRKQWPKLERRGRKAWG